MTSHTPTAPPLPMLVLVTASGTLGMHVMVPALPALAREFGTGTGPAQLTISLYLIGLALGQLVHGPVSDRLGRRPALLIGLGLYLVGGLASAAAPGIWELLAARFLQAFGGCAGLVLGRAMVRDTAPGAVAAARLATLNLVMALAPGAAPLLGGFLVEGFGWRAIPLVLALMGAVTIPLALRFLPETRPPGRAESLGALMATYLRLLRSPAFLGYAVAGACTTTSMYAFMAASPFIVIDRLGRGVHELGLVYLVLMAGVSLGSFLAGRLARRLAADTILRVAMAGSIVSAGVFLAAVLAGFVSLPLTVGAMFAFTTCAGTASPFALVRSISVDPQATGTAAGLYGFGQMALGAACAGLAGLGGDPALAAALVLTGAALIGQVAIRFAARGSRR